MIIRYQSNIGGLRPGSMAESMSESEILPTSGPGSAPIWTEATWVMRRLSVWQRRRITARGNGSFPFPAGGVDPPLSGRRPASATPFLAAGHPPLSTGTVPLPSLRTRPKDWSTQKPPVCLNPPQTPGNSQRRDFGGQRLTQRLVCPFFSALVRREGAGHPPRRVKIDLELHHQD